jgi:hypothetical protein
MFRNWSSLLSFTLHWTNHEIACPHEYETVPLIIENVVNLLINYPLQVIDFVKKHIGSQKPQLAGNSNYVDYLFLKVGHLQRLPFVCLFSSWLFMTRCVF